MTITLTPDQRAWIEAHVASGDDASIEDAARSLLDAAILDHGLHDDDLAWAQPLVDEALAEVERGETISAEESRAEIFAFLRKLERQWLSFGSRVQRSGI